MEILLTEISDFQMVLDYIHSHWPNTIRHEPDDVGNLIGLPYPYTVPCQNEPTMQNNFCWDTYFTDVGLLRQGFIELSKNNVDNLLFEVEKFVSVPNGNRTFFLTRSQAPFLSLMIKDIYEALRDRKWLGSALAVFKLHSSMRIKIKVPICSTKKTGTSSNNVSKPSLLARTSVARCCKSPLLKKM